MSVSKVCPFILSACLVVTTVWSPEGKAMGNVVLAATLNKALAMQPVQWRVIRLNDKQVVKTSTSHSMTVALDSGRYRAEASLNNVTRKREFTVTGDTQVDVVIAMD